MTTDREEGADGDRGFNVQDRRRFDSEGQPRAGDGPGRDATRDSTQDQALPEIDFSTFILSLVTSAMMHLGEAPNPDGASRQDLSLAKQTIDLLALLQEKTQGNVSDDERRLLEEVLYDLRLRYVGAAR